MAFNLTNAAAVLKEWYLDPIRGQLNQATPLLAELDRDNEHNEGKRIYLPLHTGRSESVASISETGDLPTARNQETNFSVFNNKYHVGTIELTLPAIKATASERGSFLRGLSFETTKMMDEFKENLDRQLGSNDSLGRGTLANTAAGGPSTTVNIAAEFTTRFRLRKNMTIDIIDVDDDSELATDRTITSVTVDSSGQVTAIVISGAAVTTDSTHRIVRANSWKKEMVGVPGIVSTTGVLQGLDPVTETYWKANEAENGAVARAINDDVIQAGADKVWYETGGDIDALGSNLFQKRKYAASLTPQKRFTNSLELKGGFKTITWNDDVPFLLDKYFPNNAVFGLSRKHMKIYELADYDWMDDDGAILSRVAGKMAYGATLYRFCELGTDRRNAHVKISDLSES